MGLADSMIPVSISNTARKSLHSTFSETVDSAVLMIVEALDFLKCLRKNQLSKNPFNLHCYVLGNNMGT